jgi:REP element-mobilizing transposase RayT
MRGRTGRIKSTAGMAYYHVVNRFRNQSNQCLDEVDLEYAVRLLKHLSCYYLVEVISFAFMRDHFHIVAAVPGSTPAAETIAARHNAYYGQKPEKELDPQDPKVLDVGRNMVNVSEFMRAFQQRFSARFNVRHKLKGRNWADRFKSTLLEGGDALLECVKYVELNPAQEELCAIPADYRFCSWGRFRGSGQHPFAQNFVKHLGTTLGSGSWKQIFRAFGRQLDRELTPEHAASWQEKSIDGQVLKKHVVILTLKRRCRYWTDGLAIGSKLFVDSIKERLHDKGRQVLKEHVQERRKPPCLVTGSGAELFPVKRLNLGKS